MCWNYLLILVPYVVMDVNIVSDLQEIYNKF
jgi:hypothetical protein